MTRLLPMLTLALMGCERTPQGEPVEPDTGGPADELGWAAPADGLELQGTLLLPDRDAEVPLVVLVHGSGPNARDQPVAGQLNMGFGFTIPMFEQLATDLQGRGLAVYRYDKRTCGPFNGCAANGYPAPSADLTVDDFAADAIAAIDSLRDHPAIDADRLWVVGHSQGGQLVPHIVQEGGLAGGVMVAGPHDPLDEMLAYQLSFTESLMRETGADEATIESATADLRAMVQGTAALREGTHDGSPIGGVPAAFWSSWMRAGDRAPEIAEGLSVPLLALGGDYDWNVPPDQLRAWDDSFSSHGAPREAGELSCLTHALNCVSQPDWRRITPADIATRVDPVVAERISAEILLGR